jgi:hypothetical protein
MFPFFLGQSRGQDLAHDFGSIGQGASRAGSILQTDESLLIEPLQPEAGGALVTSRAGAVRDKNL